MSGTNRQVCRKRRRGNATLSMLALMSGIMFAALVVDLGYTRVCRTELQNAADAATMAGVGYLDGTPAGMEAARQAAIALNESILTMRMEDQPEHQSVRPGV